jgi:predicted lipoprotein with Yx(FWY)xxD motif
MRLSIRHSFPAALAIGVAALLLAACGGGDDDGDATAAGSDSGAGLVSVQDVDGNDVLADSEGRTLYTAEVEEGGEILCVEACTSFWDPVTATAAESKAASEDLGLDLGVVERPEGDRQLTFEGLPLYTFTDEDAGQLEGDGFVDDFQGTHFEWAAAFTGGGSGSWESDGPSGISPY